MGVLFYGNGGSGNHGCEAIVRGTASLLGEMDYTVFSENVDEDLEYGLGSIASIVPAKKERGKGLAFLAAYAKLKATGDYTDLDGLPYLQTIKGLNRERMVALSVGGDNYCYGNDALYGYLNRAYHRKGIKTVLWGCSIEPDIVSKQTVAEDLRRYDLVVARESITYEAIKSAGAKSVLMPDPAIFMNCAVCSLDDRFKSRNVIGINLSPVIISSEAHAGTAYANYKALIQYILEKTNAYIALIPHVVWSSNDDRCPLKELYEDLGRDERLILVGDHTAPELKYIISQCCFFVGARTHATIAAYSSCVPTLVVGYSVKARGIAKDLFGTEEGYVLPIQRMKNACELTDAFVNLYRRADKMRDHLGRIMPEYTGRAKAVREMVVALAHEA